MIYIVNQSNKPDFNIALEEYCFKQMTQFDKVFILWINEPSIIVGKNQNTHAEINEKYVQENGIHVVRRISGGGAVYHDLNNLNYTIISNEDRDSRSFDFKAFSEPVIQTLQELGVEAEFSGRNDITIQGKKISGNAQAYLDGRVMHHGCILFDVDLTVLSKALETSTEVVEAKGVKSVRSRVDNILPNLQEKITVTQFADRILEHMKRKYPEMQAYHFNEEELQAIERRRQTKFGNWNWNFGTNPVAEIVRERRYPAGKTQVFIDTKKEVIEDITFYGTFFGVRSDLTAVQQLLKGVKYTPDEVRKRLSSFDISPYFAGFSIDELTDAIVG
ncbi:MAG: lipoate--protein ligase [Proteiniphilum sp.]|nr:lipoate--protein ligase [Proteiniphilum sp.]